MRRDRAMKVVVVVVGLLFTAGVVPLTMFFSREPAVPMIMSIYVTLGISLLLAVRDPAANRSEPVQFSLRELSQVPEPGTLMLLGSGLVALGFIARRKLAL